MYKLTRLKDEVQLPLHCTRMELYVRHNNMTGMSSAHRVHCAAYGILTFADAARSKISSIHLKLNEVFCRHHNRCYCVNHMPCVCVRKLMQRAHTSRIMHAEFQLAFRIVTLNYSVPDVHRVRSVILILWEVTVCTQFN